METIAPPHPTQPDRKPYQVLAREFDEALTGLIGTVSRLDDIAPAGRGDIVDQILRAATHRRVELIFDTHRRRSPRIRRGHLVLLHPPPGGPS